MIGGGVLAAALVGILAAGSMQPDTTHIERHTVVQAAPGDVFPYLNDLDKWMLWNPWKDMDPSQTTTFSENRVGVGAWYEWKGEKVGAGRMTITGSTPDTKLTDSLVFTEPFQSEADVSFTLTPQGEGTKIVWGYDADNNFMAKVMGLFMDMDKMLGGDFERGLTSLKPLVEAEATKRTEAEAAAKAQAEAEAAAAAAAADPNAQAVAP